MKKLKIGLLIMLPFMGFGQIKENGKIYIEHPAINVAETFTKAFVKGDTAKLASLLTEDFKAIDGLSPNSATNSSDKKALMGRSIFWSQSFDYLTITPSAGSYPDAFEYAGDKGDITVVRWDDAKGIHKKTGVKANLAMQRTFIINKDNKIKGVIMYSNPEMFNEISASNSNRKNGTIYNQHENINSLRIMMGALENGDLAKYYSFSDPKATFISINNPEMKAITLEENKAQDKAFMGAFDIKSIEQFGYPDFMQYEMGNRGGKSGTLYSWWNTNLIRKSDKKEIKLFVHYSHTVNAEGKIVNEVIYYNDDLLK